MTTDVLDPHVLHQMVLDVDEQKPEGHEVVIYATHTSFWAIRGDQNFGDVNFDYAKCHENLRFMGCPLLFVQATGVYCHVTTRPVMENSTLRTLAG